MVQDTPQQNTENNVGRPTKEQEAESKEVERRRKIGEALTKMTPEVVGKIREALAIDLNITQACNYAGINTTTYYDWIRKNPAKMVGVVALGKTWVSAVYAVACSCCSMNSVSMRVKMPSPSSIFAVARATASAPARR